MYTFSIIFTKFEKIKFYRIVRYVFCAFLLLDFIVFSINPFIEIAISFDFTNTVTYKMGALYIVHLVFDYVMVAFLLFVFFSKTRKLPKAYKTEHLYLGVMILIVIFVNAIYLIVQNT